MGIPQKIKNRTTTQSTSENITKGNENTMLMRNVYPHDFIASLFLTAKTQKQPKCTVMDEWIKKMWSLYTGEYYLAIKKRKSYHL